MTRPIVVLLRQGLGNLLFQYAAALTVGNRVDRPVVFGQAQPGRLDLLEAGLGTAVPRASVRQQAAVGRVPLGPLPARAVARVVRGLAGSGSLLASSFTALPDTDELRDVRVMAGWFQHVSFAEPSARQVLGSLQRSFASELEGCMDRDLLAVSLRRGDYVQNGWLLPDSYYERAASEALSSGVDRAVVTCDDAWARLAVEVRLQDLGFSIVDAATWGGPARPSRRDFARIAGAGHVILSNSTFAWWGAALGDHLWGDGDGAGVVHERQVWYPGGWLPNRNIQGLRRSSWREVPVWNDAV